MHYKKSNTTEHDLHTYCEKYKHKPNNLVQANLTRWNSRHGNMSSPLHHKDCINSMGEDDKLDSDLVPTCREWKMVEGACEVLEHLTKTTKDWEQEKVPTINLVAKKLYESCQKLKAFSKDKTKKGFGMDFAKILLKKINRRFPK